MSENSMKIQEGFRKLLPVFAGYIGRELCQYCTNAHWWSYVLTTLEDQVREHPGDLPKSGTYSELVDSLDMANCLRLFDRSWNELFRKKLSIDYRTWCKELMGVRNKVSHLGSGDVDENYTWRALDTMSLVCGAFDDEVAEEIREMQRALRYGSTKGSAQSTAPAAETTTKSSGVLSTSLNGLPSWRTIIEPHPDVAQGRYKHAEFAADLAQVARGEGAFEYRDPVEFFDRTYVTEGMAGLLTQAVKRVSGQDGEPVIQLKTAFGGGKTHSMLALYHMLRARVSVDKIPSVKPILDAAGLHTLPKANVAVLVGTSLDPAKARRPQNLPGITINTLWGEMAAQLCESSGDLSLYEYVKEADKKGISPGSEALKNLLDACGPCLILMDELVAYAKKLYGVSNLPAGSFDNFITFVQEITEAARASKNSLVVASIPQSDIEVGGDAGKIALESIEHTFGRMESIWKPVAANEGFEVVRRRLFLNCKDTAARDMICSEFSKFYSDNKADFPIEASEVAYRERMISCYPIHPEVFDRLYNDWSTLERFQRTRGVLRLMAAVIHELWMGSDANAMIMPGSIPLDVQNVSYELTRHLGDDNWNAIIDSEVDGKNSAPYKLEKENSRFGGKFTARRVTRTVFLGSAPTTRGQSIRGLDIKNVHLGAILPGENIAEFNDAIISLQSKLSYLYTTSGDRFWYDTRPTLRKTVEERATQIPVSEVEYDIEKRLSSKIKKEALFDKPHICPSSSLDIPDDQNVRLVVLSPKDTYKNNQNNDAITKAEEYLNNRGTSPRIYRNMLVFIAPDQTNLASLKEAVKLLLAWKSIADDSDTLNLDAGQNRETQNNIKRCDETVNARLLETYCWLLVPMIDRTLDIKQIQWEAINIRGGNQSIVQKASDKLVQNEALITRWAPALLKMELDNILWKDSDHISIKQLWDYLSTYCYLPRLKDYSVLEETIRNGVNSDEYFTYASGIDNGRYIDLKYNKAISFVDKTGYLVKLDPARKQLLAEASAQPSNPVSVPVDNLGDNISKPVITETVTGDINTNQVSSAVQQPTQFFMSAKLDTTRINRDVQNLVQEVISHLTELDNCNVEITLEVSAASDDGFSPPIVRTVSENCKTLKVDNFGFES